MVADRPSASLLRSDTAEWRLWSLVAELAHRLEPRSWVLIGDQMVALHLHLAGATPGRTTTDVDIVADILTDHNSFHACRAIALEMGLEAQASITGKNLHRFSGPAGHLDLMVPDHLPVHVTRRFTMPAPRCRLQADSVRSTGEPSWTSNPSPERPRSRCPTLSAPW